MDRHFMCAEVDDVYLEKLNPICHVCIEFVKSECSSAI